MRHNRDTGFSTGSPFLFKAANFVAFIVVSVSSQFRQPLYLEGSRGRWVRRPGYVGESRAAVYVGESGIPGLPAISTGAGADIHFVGGAPAGAGADIDFVGGAPAVSMAMLVPAVVSVPVSGAGVLFVLCGGKGPTGRLSKVRPSFGPPLVEMIDVAGTTSSETTGAEGAE